MTLALALAQEQALVQTLAMVATLVTLATLGLVLTLAETLLQVSAKPLPLLMMFDSSAHLLICALALFG